MTDEIQVKTNSARRPVVDAYELTQEERADFDYIDWPAIDNGQDSASFLRYKGQLYDLSEFGTTSGLPDFNPLRQWDGYLSDTFFSGIVVRYVGPDCDEVVAGTFFA